MKFATQKCLDGETLIVGPGLLTEDVKNVVTLLSKCRFTDIDDVLCASNAVDEEIWLLICERDRKVIYSLIANTYSIYIDDIDNFIDILCGEGIELCFNDGTFIPDGEYLLGLENTIVKKKVA